MARQKIEDNLFYVIFRVVPTWAAAIVVIASYPVLRWLLPFLTRGSLWSQVGSAFAPCSAFILALIALFAEADKYSRRRLLSQQSSLDTLRRMTWLEFEHLVGEVYRQQGYKVEERGGAQADGGVDLVLRGHGETVLVQCKQWRTQQVSVKPLRELRGIIADEKATRGIFVTVGGYTQAALLEAVGKPLELIDGIQLLKLVKQVQSSSGQSQPVIPSERTSVSARPGEELVQPLCPKCGSAMKRRTARQGPNTGNDFWGCSRFPNCRGNVPL